MKKIIFKLTLAFSISAFSNTTALVTKDAKLRLDFSGCDLLSTADKNYTYDLGCLKANVDELPVTHADYSVWKEMVQRPIAERLIKANQDVLNFLKLKNVIFDFPYESLQFSDDPEMIQAAQKALSSLPAEMTKYIGRHFFGFMVVKNAGWSGFAIAIKPVEGVGPGGSVIVINADNIRNRNLNDWLKFREASAFNLNETTESYPKYDIRMTFSAPGKTSSIEETLRYVLLHEVAHLIAVAVQNIHPLPKFKNNPMNVWEILKTLKPGQLFTTAFSFLPLSWNFSHTKDAHQESAFRFTRKLPAELESILGNKPVKYYTTDLKARFSAAEAIEIYKGLNQTCYPSLYATVDFMEDFAESVTHYFMITKEGYQFTNEVLVQESPGSEYKVVAKFEDKVWESKTCVKKKEYIESLFAQPDRKK